MLEIFDERELTKLTLSKVIISQVLWGIPVISGHFGKCRQEFRVSLNIINLGCLGLSETLLGVGGEIPFSKLKSLCPLPFIVT